MECTNCRTSVYSCSRCGAETCVDHMALEHRDTCLDCALAFYDSQDKLHLNAWFIAGFILPWALYLRMLPDLPSWSERSGGYRAMTTGFPALDVLIIVGFVSVFAGKAMIGLRKWMHRRTFVTRELARAKLVR
ncbi:MAG TPA: hypothetical protein VFV99_11430 [Kofleriaceae bacterium]|nr:hypothetical protein [Kofleriaceae bacterium]